MKLAIGLVTGGGYADFLPQPFVWSFYELHSAILRGQTPVRHNFLIRNPKFPTDVARNEICRDFLASESDRLLFLDVDHEFRPEAVIRLLESDHAIVTGRYHVKRPPFHPTLYLTPTEAHRAGQFRPIHYGQGVFPVDRCGAGALLIKREVINVVGDPWFRYGEDPDPPHDRSVSEDFYFCERAQAEGFTIMADWEAEFDHLVPNGRVNGSWQRQYLDVMERDIAHDKPELVEKLVACGFPDGYRLPSGHVVPPYGSRVSG